MKSLIMLCVFLGWMSMASSGLGEVSNSVTCPDALKTLMPCLPYLTGTIPSPSATCCIGVSTLKAKADTTEARRSICQCLKDAAPKIGVITDRAKLIPQLCKVELPAPVDPDVDCSKIHLSGHAIDHDKLPF